MKKLLLTLVCCAVLCLPALAIVRDKVPGSFYFYPREIKDDPTNAAGFGLAKIVRHSGKYELFEWGRGGQCLRFTPDKIGDFITFRIRVAEADPGFTYKVQTVAAWFNNEGIYQWEVNGQPFGAPHDCFGRDEWTHGDWPITPKEYEITYRCVGKNPSSSGMVANLIRLEFHLSKNIPR